MPLPLLLPLPLPLPVPLLLPLPLLLPFRRRSVSARSLPFFIALACMLAPAAAPAAQWEKVGDTGVVAAFVDRDSVRRSGSEARAWVEWRWAEPADDPGSNPPRRYRLERQMQISRCDDKSYAAAEGTRYADERGTEPVSSYKRDESSLAWYPAPPRTIRAAVLDRVCSLAAASGKP